MITVVELHMSGKAPGGTCVSSMVKLETGSEPVCAKLNHPRFEKEEALVKNLPSLVF